MSDTIAELIKRARAFRAGTYVEKQPLYQELVREGQAPKVLMIACSDSRVDPSIIFDADPGELFMVRNVASLVPPYMPGAGCRGTSAAIEFAVTGLNVEHIIVLGHGHCGGIDALLRRADEGEIATDFIGPWLASAASVRDALVAEVPDLAHEDQARALEFATVRNSVSNLRSFPFVEERVLDGRLSLHAWHFDIAAGAILDVADKDNPVQISG